jgi:Tat protein secretion system quality control protein TatD with DNase activity
MKIIDSHCHLDRVDLSAFGGSMESLLAHAKTLSNPVSPMAIILSSSAKANNSATLGSLPSDSQGCTPTEA